MGHLKHCPVCKGKHRKESAYKRCKRKAHPEAWSG